MCNKCNSTCSSCPCTCSTLCVTTIPCACPILINSDCVENFTEDLVCSNILKGQTLTETIVKLDAYICERFDSVTNFFQLINVGGGSEVYKGVNLLGKKEIRTLVDSSLINIVQGTDIVTISVDEAAMNTFIEANQKTYSVVNTGTGSEVYKSSTIVGDNTQFNLRKIKSSDSSVSIVQGTDDINITVSAAIVPDGSETKVTAGTDISVTGTGTTLDPYVINSEVEILDVSATVSGIVNNTSLQELGGEDKLINGIRVGTGAGTGIENTVLGLDALPVSTNGAGNTAIGAHSLFSNTTGYSNTSVGNAASSSITSGFGNTALGAYALSANIVGTNNTAIGITALALATGISNTAVGSGAQYSTTTASNNVAVGIAAMQNNTTGGNNVALGYQAAGSLSTGTDNVVVGYQFNVSAGLTTGSNNVFLGNTLNGITTGSGNVTLGKPTGLTSSATNTITIADGVGNIAITKATDDTIVAPNLTTALITAATGRVLVTKEYLASVAPDGSETIVTAGTDITVTGAGTTGSPYVINSTALVSLGNFIPVNVGYFTGLDTGVSSGALVVSGDITAATATSTSGDSTITCTMANAMPDMNYFVRTHLQSLGTLGLDNDTNCPVFKILSTTQFQIAIRESSATTQNYRVHVEVLKI